MLVGNKKQEKEVWLGQRRGRGQLSPLRTIGGEPYKEGGKGEYYTVLVVCTKYVMPIRRNT
jgi:hypothetical protein